MNDFGTAAVFGALGLGIAAYALVNLLRPALGARLWRVGGLVPLHHALTDPDKVRSRLLSRAVVLALPALAFGPLSFVYGVMIVGSLVLGGDGGWRVSLVGLGLLLVGAGVTVVGYGALWAAWRVRHRRIVPGRASSLLMRGSLYLAAIAALAIWIYVPPAGDAGFVALWAGVPTVWLASALVLANEMRIVATWDRLCEAGHRKMEEVAHGYN